MSHAGTDPTPDYTELDGCILLQEMGDDAYKWAEAFCQHAKKFKFDLNDRGIMISWFANAIEYSSDVRRWRAEQAAKGETVCATPPLTKGPSGPGAATP